MTTPTLIINGRDALAEWGIVPLSNLIGELLAPPPAKDPVKNTSRLEHGSRFLLPGGRTILASRDLTLDLRIRAASESDFLAKYNSLIRELESGWLSISTDRLPGLVFKCVYLSCSQYSQYNGNVAKFILRLNEPNPANRS